jgi:HSP20 family protein
VTDDGRVGLRAFWWGLPQGVGRAETFVSVVVTLAPGSFPDTDLTGGDRRPRNQTLASSTMLTLRSTSPFDLFDRIEQQLSQQLHTAERVPAAEVHETAEAYEVVLELPGVDKDAIDVKATDRTLVISAERRNQRQLPLQPAADAVAEGATATPVVAEKAKSPLISEFRYGTWSRSFRFPQPIERDQLEARYQGGLLTVKAPKAQKATTVTVRVEG